MSVQETSNKVRSLNLCFNCLGHHLIKNCLKLNRKCRVCNANHNSLLCKTSVPRPISEPHQNRNLPSPQSSSGVIYDPTPGTVINPQTATCLYNEIGEKSILLSTAKVKVQSATGGWLVMNTILDSGSQKCICSLEASNFLGLEKYSMNSTIVGLNGACISVRKRISAEISNGSSFKRKLNFLIVPKITGCVPTQPLDLTKIKLPPNITYADAEFNIPKRIDILLGEAIGIKAASSCDPDDQATQNFKSSVRFNSGRYEVGFPWKSHTQELNDNFSVAEKRVKSLTRRFIRDPTLYIQYSEILKEYESQGIIERVLETEKPTDRAVFYLPHQAVFRQESLTTKMRIVFDASSHEDRQPSLNDCIWSGENLNPNIFHLIISFRLNTIVITADIERAFLQISLRDEDRDAVRFLFPDIRSNQTDPYKFQVYRFKRVMFGVNVSPFLLSATIKHHIENYREQYPSATEMLDTCLYVDDVISGADDISQALKVSKDAETIMKNASMKLRKWNSNDQTLMRTWEKEGLETHPRHPDDSSKIPSSKVLGIQWDVVHDYFTIDVKGLLQLDTSKPITKRIVLQSAGKIYDPVGFLSPYTIRLKCLLQELWLRKLSWDDELPPDIHAVWSQCSLELPFLSELKIPRKILDSSGDSSEVQIHTFSDASQKAYGAAAFLRVKHKNRVSVDLVTSKSHVAPLKSLSLPRLELMGALLAARLAKEVKKILDQKCSTRAFFWTDSQVTLHCIKGPSHRWKPFVANRVREIQSLTDPNSWFHCSGKDNPADLLTRGISVDALTTNSKRWNGSSFLRQIDFQTKGLDEAIPERVCLTEMRKNSNPKEDISLTLTVTKNNFLENIIDISNNYVKSIRVVSFLYRFIHNCRTRITKIKGPLTSQEVSHAENWLIHSLHEREFYEEMRKLLADFVTDLTSQAFIASLKRFFGRRGKCAKITTDNAKTFVGANAEIKKLFKMIKLPDHTLAEFLTNESIEWNFIPPRSPNHGGLWEAGVKAFKFHLKRVVGNAHLTLEEFIIILCEIEAVLNSRPLTPLTSNFDDFETLTPGHFLVGRPLTSIVEPQITNINENQLSRWERVKKITQHIYKLWKRDYLNNLQERHKWKFNKNNVSVGTLVLIKDENLPSTKWSTGRITEIFPGTDGKVRVVNLRMPNGKILKRTIRNLCILPV
ncbi:integrase catalytic domain-containing protein [Trichonephila clavipes]|nr:integrase catalytic domain-containing protein [Trichonephila clavipes]